MVTVAPFRTLRASRRAKPSGLSDYFFLGMSAGRQARRIRELADSGLPMALIAIITERDIGAVRKALRQAAT